MTEIAESVPGQESRKTTALCWPEDVKLNNLARLTDGYTGADMASVCNTAVMLALRELIGKANDPEGAKKKAKDLKMPRRQFDEVLRKVKPISGQELRMYERFSQQFSEAAKPAIQPIKRAP